MATPINRDIKYLNRDFSDIRTKLIEFSQTYFPNTYNDFSPTSPGMMFMEQAAYVSDVMSFYLDNQLQETFTTLARQTNNLYELAYMFGYKPKATTAAQVEIDLYQQLPARWKWQSRLELHFNYRRKHTSISTRQYFIKFFNTR